MVSSYARTKEASQAKYISILNIIQGEVDPTQVSEEIYKNRFSAHSSQHLFLCVLFIQTARTQYIAKVGEYFTHGFSCTPISLHGVTHINI